MISITFANASVDTGSSPFYDYTHDSLYVGDDVSALHKFVNVFGISGATPSEVTTSPWPFDIDGAFALNSPVFDGASGNIFVDDLNGTLSYVRETFSTVGTCKTGSPPCIGSTTVVPSQIHSLIDAPIVDSSTQKVFVFYANYDGTNMAVVQSDTALSAKVAATTGSKVNQRHMHAGAFDNTYLSRDREHGTPLPLRRLGTGLPTLMRIGFNNTATYIPECNRHDEHDGRRHSDVASRVLARRRRLRPAHRIFQLQRRGRQPGSTLLRRRRSDGASATCIAADVGCVMSVNITNTPAALTIGSSIAEIMGASGIIVDNNANTTSFPQASSLYFSNQGNSTNALKCGATTGVGCAIKVTQSGLN